MPENSPYRNRGEYPVGSTTRRHRFSKTLLFASVLLCLCLTLCYWLRPDHFAAFTILPAWCWPLLGLLLTAFGWERQLRRKVVTVAVMWFLFLLSFSDEPRSLLRSLLPPATGDESRRLRVVSLNCSGGDPAAAAEVIGWQPDVVLLQESPSRADVEQLARKLFGEDGGVLWGVDGSIIARGKFTPRPLPPALRNYFVQTHVRLPQGKEIELFSLRLMTPPFRLDFWSPSCWQAYRQNRRLQRRQMDAIRQQLNAVPKERAIIIGGDFNAPQGDAIFSALRPRLRDSFSRAGRGWGNTIINDFPALRIDQIWASEALQPHNVIARRTKNSDHRAVVADFLWRTHRVRSTGSNYKPVRRRSPGLHSKGNTIRDKISCKHSNHFDCSARRDELSPA